MKRLLLSTAAIALISGVSYAADLPVMEAPAPIVEAAPIPANWAGFYVGIHGGYGWGNAEFDDDDDDDDDDDFDFDDADIEGGIVGGQIGGLWQWNWFVLGAEIDGSAFLTEDDDEDFGFDDDDDDDDDDDFNGDFGAEAYWLASARLRAGIGFDRLLVYGTGGIGFGEFEHEFASGRGSGGSGDDDDDDGEVEVGPVFGGGVEFLVTDNVSIGAEYLHYEFGEIGDDDDDDDDDDFDDPFDDADINADVDVIRGRVNIKTNGLFGGG